MANVSILDDEDELLTEEQINAIMDVSGQEYIWDNISLINPDKDTLEAMIQSEDEDLISYAISKLDHQED